VACASKTQWQQRLGGRTSPGTAHKLRPGGWRPDGRALLVQRTARSGLITASVRTRWRDAVHAGSVQSPASILSPEAAKAALSQA